MIKDLINDIAYDKITLSQALTRAKIIAYKVENDIFRDWIKQELQGYKNDGDLLPDYRSIECMPYVTIDYGYNKRQTVPMDFRLEEKKADAIINRAEYFEPIGAIETFIETANDSAIELSFPPNLLSVFQGMLERQNRRGQIISGYKRFAKGAVTNILEQTKQTLMETLMELNKQFPDLENEFLPTKENSEKVQNIITTNIYGNNNPTNIAAGDTVTQKDITSTLNVDEKKLSDLGVQEEFISELKKIIADTKDKSTIGSKALKWIGAVSTSLVSKGLADKIPLVTKYVQGLIQ